MKFQLLQLLINRKTLLSNSDVLFIMFINVKMPTIVELSMKSFITSGPVLIHGQFTGSYH